MAYLAKVEPISPTRVRSTFRVPRIVLNDAATPRGDMVDKLSLLSRTPVSTSIIVPSGHDNGIAYFLERLLRRP